MAIREPRTRTRLGRRPARRRTAIYDHTRQRTMPPAPPPPDWRSDITSLSGLNVVAGIWLIIAPWVLGYSANDPVWNDVVFGAIVGVFALIRATSAYREQWLSWVNGLIGIWLFIAAFTIDYSAAASWNDIILGIIVFLLALSSAESTINMLERRRGL